MDDGLFEITNNHISMLATTNVNGGIIRCGGSWLNSTDGNFQPTGGLQSLLVPVAPVNIFTYTPIITSTTSPSIVRIKSRFIHQLLIWKLKMISQS
ncbi:MAG: hypothetical protein R2764_02760 [Bacteroidales bacterium]